MPKKNTTKRNKWVNFFKRPAILVFIASLFLIVINLYLAVLIRPFTSDDVAWQNALLTWRPFNHQTLFLSSDPFIIKFPFYALLNHLLGPSRTSLILTAVIFAVINFSCFYLAILYFFRKLRIRATFASLLPILWISSFGHAFHGMFLNPNLRNAELGLMFLFFAYIAMLYYGEIQFRPRWLRLSLHLAAFTLVGLLILNDLYFLYYGVVPAGLLLAYLFMRNKPARLQTVKIAAGLCFSVLVAKACKLLIIKSGGTFMKSETSFVAFDKLFSNIAAALHSTLIIFSADFWGRLIVHVATMTYLLNAVILCVVLYCCYQLYRHKPEKDPVAVVWLRFFSCLFVFVLLIYTLSDVSYGTETYRYLIVLPYLLVLPFAYLIHKKRLPLMPALVSLVLVGSIGLNVITTVGLERGALKHPRDQNELNVELVEAVMSRNLTKGYAPYWQANINSYFSKGKVQFLPIACPNGRVARFNWLVDGSQFEKATARSFFILDPTHQEGTACPRKNLDAQFGPPSDVVTIEARSILIYTHDITSLVDPGT